MNTATPTLEGTAPQWREESLQNSHHYGCGVATDFFINHSIAGGYSYADQAQAFANWQVSHPPFGGILTTKEQLLLLILINGKINKELPLPVIMEPLTPNPNYQ